MENIIEPIINQDFYVLVAPDGNMQLSSIAEDLPTCMAFVKLLYKAGFGQSWHELKMKGFSYEKVKLTIIQEKPEVSA